MSDYLKIQQGVSDSFIARGGRVVVFTSIAYIPVVSNFQNITSKKGNNLQVPGSYYKTSFV